MRSIVTYYTAYRMSINYQRATHLLHAWSQQKPVTQAVGRLYEIFCLKICIQQLIKFDKQLFMYWDDELDNKAKFSQLNDDELNLKNTLNERLAQLLREEEIKCTKGKAEKIYWNEMQILNISNQWLIGKHRKTRTFQLEQEDGTISGDACLKKFITKYYKILFSSPKPTFSTMDKTRIDDIPKSEC